MLELYLQVRIRSDSEIEAYNEELFQLEKEGLVQKSGFSLVEKIKETVANLMAT